MSIPVETQWRDRWKGEIDYLLWLLVMHWLHLHIHWRFQWELTQSRRVGLHQIGLCNQLGLTWIVQWRQAIRRQKSVHGFVNLFMIVCDDWLYWELDVLRFVWDCYIVSMIHNIWYLGFLALVLPIKQLCYVCFYCFMCFAIVD